MLELLLGLLDDDPRAASYRFAPGVHVALVPAFAPVDLIARVPNVYVDQVVARRALDHVLVAREGVGPYLVVPAPEDDPVAQAVALALVDEVVLACCLAGDTGALDGLVGRPQDHGPP